ncbi:MAG: tRNA uridine-5-carboxymethylaminomethyl(34) synthesis GTPase MnmE [Candidatus Eremiobacteraeota bacterium]|nr:tRNA uridine-5-carboxymethylaminomethyl(34) synthesis GTPase MnmE [Candidatus Eremiobacteraeota bacterium]MBC5804443.1 tRNA uridine-5-carboxymethylaminomethyl(34) synthesis GTPase MnmE [Candidatus Eremiobacteraeota bacterium]MBC5820777.1 tRNA uridine-5-carboxymethylaminomethyl(34) synthesis GTPase MnmE [Candidatus Eremiobacteraeota bacterium]
MGGGTIAAIATPPGRGAIAIVRVSGPLVRDIARALCPGAPLRPRRAETRPVVDGDGLTIDRGLALFFPAPHSYTGEDVLELHVHGSTAVARDTMLAALALGARAAEAGEFTRRAYEAGKLDLCAAEAVAELIAAEHRGAARAASARMAGGLASEVERLRAELATILAELTATLDFPDEVAAPDASDVRVRVEAVDGALEELARTWERGQVMREGAAVAIVGPPNAGKSSVFNGLLGSERALVSELAGTTRDTLEESVALGDGGVARLIDTAGMRHSADALEAAGVARSEGALAAASLVLVVVDASRPLDPAASDVLRRTRACERLVYFNKADVGRVGYDQREPAEGAALLGCAHARASLEAVRAALCRRLGDGPVDVARPHLGTARQADAVLEARRSLAAVRETLDAHAPLDLVASDLAAAHASLGALSGRDAGEAVLDAVFARFCVGK